MPDALSPRDVILACMFERNRRALQPEMDGAIRASLRHEADAVLASLFAAGFVVTAAIVTPADVRTALKLVEGNPHARGFE